jgi:hypothetical protein
MARDFWGVSNDRERCVCPSRAIGIDRYELRPMSEMDLRFRAEGVSLERFAYLNNFVALSKTTERVTYTLMNTNFTRSCAPRWGSCLQETRSTFGGPSRLTGSASSF